MEGFEVREVVTYGDRTERENTMRETSGGYVLFLNLDGGYTGVFI